MFKGFSERNHSSIRTKDSIHDITTVLYTDESNGYRKTTIYLHQHESSEHGCSIAKHPYIALQEPAVECALVTTSILLGSGVYHNSINQDYNDNV